MSASQSVGGTPPPVVSNDAIKALMREYALQKRRCHEENGVLRNILKRGKKDGVNVKALVTAAEAAGQDSDVVIRDLSDTIHYMALRSIPVSRETLFDGWDTDVTGKSQSIDDLWTAGERGYHAGRDGQKVEDAPYLAGTEFHNEWLRNWQQGQAAIARELGPDAKVASTTRERPAGRGRQPRIPGTDAKQMAPKKAGSTRKRAASRKQPAKRKAPARRTNGRTVEQDATAPAF
jgi:ribosome modulation factor